MYVKYIKKSWLLRSLAVTRMLTMITYLFPWKNGVIKIGYQLDFRVCALVNEMSVCVCKYMCYDKELAIAWNVQSDNN